MNVQVCKAVSTFIVRECAIFLGFSWRDWSTTIIPGYIIANAAIRSTTISLQSAALRAICLGAWVTTYVYLFDLSNQITGVDEDRLNKPDRPIPSGLVTMDGAKARWLAVLVMFMTIGSVHSPILPETLVYVVDIAFLNLTSAGDHWLGKDCVGMAIGTWTLLSGCWKIIAPLNPTNLSYILTVALWTGLLSPIQDFRDVKGDAKVGRRTMPLVYGETTSRTALVFGFIPAAFLVLYVGQLAEVAPTPLASAHAYLGYRMLKQNGPLHDHKTYMLLTYLFCAVIASIIMKQQ